MIAELWTEDGSQILQPPQEMREIAASAGLGMAATLEAQGHAELEARAATSYEQWVGSAGLSFRRRDDVYRLHEVVKFHWEAVSPDGEVTAVGLVFLVLGTDGRIRRAISARRSPSIPRLRRTRCAISQPMPPRSPANSMTGRRTWRASAWAGWSPRSPR